MDYKGIYYGESNVQKFFEFGAHFKYSDLYKELEMLGGKINQNEDKVLLRNKSNNNPKKISLIEEEKKIMTRNLNNNNIYLNKNYNTENLNLIKTIHINNHKSLIE